MIQQNDGPESNRNISDDPNQLKNRDGAGFSEEQTIATDVRNEDLNEISEDLDEEDLADEDEELDVEDSEAK